VISGLYKDSQHIAIVNPHLSGKLLVAVEVSLQFDEWILTHTGR
jgi:hypothetical protein